MATILYGLAGEGMGHAIRSKVVIGHLLKKGHNVHVVASHRAYGVMANNFPNVTEISGLTLYYEQNTVKKLKSLWQNLKPGLGKYSVRNVNKIIKNENPQVIITDYEPTVAYLAGLSSWKSFIGREKIPLISIDNQHVNSNCDIEVSEEYRDDYLLVKYGNRLVVPPRNVRQYIITTFFYPKIIKENTTLVPSLIREDIVKTKPKQEGHILVYQTSQSNTAMFDVLKKFRREKFVVYGFNKSKRDQNLTFKKFSEQEFIADMASCKAAVTNGGFTMMTEALFLHKPVFSIPVKHQFEQICNAHYLEKRGYGEFHQEITEKGFAGFLYKATDYCQNLEAYKQKDNSTALEAVDKYVKKFS
jgi:uncharacterized protein (TIGR00661 family)